MAPPLVSLRFLLFAVCVIQCQFGKSTSSTVCQSKACNNTAKFMMDQMNLTADPCDDFFEYACGTAYKNLKPTAARPYVGGFYDIEYEKLAFQIRLLEEAVQHRARESFEAKMKAMYRACMDIDEIEKVKYADYKMKYRNDWPTLNSNWTNNSFNLQALHETYHNLFTQVFFKIELFPHHEANESTYIVDLEDNKFLMADSEIKAARNGSRKMKWEKMYINFAEEFGATKAIAGNDAKSVVDLLHQLAPYMMPRANKHNVETRFNPTTLEDMNVNYPYLNWQNVFQKMFDNLQIKIPRNQKVNILWPKFFKGLGKVLATAKPRDVQNLFGFWHAFRMTNDASKKMREFRIQFNEEIFSAPRNESCTYRIDSLYNVGMAKLMARKSFGSSANSFMDSMIANIRKSFIASLNAQTWMNKSTIAKAVLKMNTMIAKIGHRRKRFSDAHLDCEYKHFVVEGKSYVKDYHQNLIQKTVLDLYHMNKPLTPERWGVSMTTTNAFNYWFANAIIFPMGILRRPLFDQNRQGYLNYGSIGYVIGHEIGHSNDNWGRYFDERGAVADWWTANDDATYKSKQKCYSDQFSNFVDKRTNKRLHGKTLVTEVIADSMGLYQAFRSFREYEKEPNSDKRLPDIGLSKNQLFFLTTAQLWCVKETDVSVSITIDDGRYPTFQTRVNGMMQNDLDFATSYNCPIGSYMNPAKKCKIWD